MKSWLNSRIRAVHAKWGGGFLWEEDLDPETKKELTPLYRLKHLVQARLKELMSNQIRPRGKGRKDR